MFALNIRIIVEGGNMKSVDGIAQSREPMLSASKRTGLSARPEKTKGRDMTIKGASWEDFADVLTIEKAGSGKEEVMAASGSSASAFSSVKETAEGGGLMAVLEKLAARSALRPENRGLQNAAERIRENLERQGLTVPSLPADEDVSPIVSPGTGNEPEEEIQAIAESAKDEACNTMPPDPVASSDGSPALAEEQISIAAENPMIFVDEEG